MRDGLASFLTILFQSVPPRQDLQGMLPLQIPSVGALFPFLHSVHLQRLPALLRKRDFNAVRRGSRSIECEIRSRKADDDRSFVRSFVLLPLTNDVADVTRVATNYNPLLSSLFLTSWSASTRQKAISGARTHFISKAIHNGNSCFIKSTRLSREYLKGEGANERTHARALTRERGERKGEK